VLPFLAVVDKTICISRILLTLKSLSDINEHKKTVVCKQLIVDHVVYSWLFCLFVVEEVGGKCLPCAVDIRDEGAVIEAVQQAVKTFGGIDILVNNASAISLTGTLETPMKR